MIIELEFSKETIENIKKNAGIDIENTKEDINVIVKKGDDKVVLTFDGGDEKRSLKLEEVLVYVDAAANQRKHGCDSASCGKAGPVYDLL